VALVVGGIALALMPRDSAMPMGGNTTARAAGRTDRTVEIVTTDALRFQPDALTVRAGETVAFVIRNPGVLPHELTIGDERLQQEHEGDIIKAGPAMGMDGDDAAFSIDVPAGQTVTLVYTFNRAGSLLYGCHVAGHYGAGMRGTITITS